MNLDELYSPENCRLVGECLGFARIKDKSHGRYRGPIWRWVVDTHKGVETSVEVKGDAKFRDWFRDIKAVPELIREALAREGWQVDQFGDAEYSDTRPHIALRHTGLESAIIVEWDTKTDPTARHALFAATVEYLKRRE